MESEEIDYKELAKQVFCGLLENGLHPILPKDTVMLELEAYKKEKAVLQQLFNQGRDSIFSGKSENEVLSALIENIQEPFRETVEEWTGKHAQSQYWRPEFNSPITGSLKVRSDFDDDEDEKGTRDYSNWLRNH